MILPSDTERTICDRARRKQTVLCTNKRERDGRHGGRKVKRNDKGTGVGMDGKADIRK